MCNLTGYSGKTPVNVDKMKLLFIYGNRRGKDGFGVVIGKKAFKYCGYEKGTDYSNSENVVYGTLFNTTKYRHSIIAHNRAKSVGFININNTHPFEYNNNGNTMFFAHNGTISNIEELAEKYDIKMTSGEVDSKILGEIIYKHGFDVLKEYNGYAAFSLLDYEEDALYLWKGLSQCDSATPSVERPLSFWQNKTKTQLYYASEAMTLATSLNVPITDIQEFEPNYLYKIKEGKIISKTFFDRSHIEYKSKTKNYYGTGAWEDNWGFYANKPSSNNNTVYEKKPKGGESKVTTQKENIFEFMSEPSPQQYKKGNIYFWKGRYYINGHLVNGINSKYIDSNNQIKFTTLSENELYNINNSDAEIFYFKEGYMIKDKEHYIKLKNAVSFHNWSVQSKQIYIHKTSIIVGTPFVGSLNNIIVKFDGIVDDDYYIKPLFSDVYYYSKNGKVYVSKQLPNVHTDIKI